MQAALSGKRKIVCCVALFVVSNSVSLLAISLRLSSVKHFELWYEISSEVDLGGNFELGLPLPVSMVPALFLPSDPTCGLNFSTRSFKILLNASTLWRLQRCLELFLVL